jgi:uncharacterized protein (UPF0303 family)
MSINIEKVDNFPEISRSGRVSEELQMIIEALKMSVKTGDKFCIKDIQKGKAYNSMQQRIRAQAKKLGYNIIIRFDASDNTLFFKASAGEENSVNSNDIAGIQSKDKVSKTK